MKKLVDVLKELNKGKSEPDKIRFAHEYPEDHFITHVYSTGSPYLDYKIKKEYGRGGFPLGRFMLVVGGESSGKTSLAASAMREVQKTGKIAVLFDVEGTFDESYIDRFNLDKDLLLHITGSNLEEMLDTAEAISTSDDVGIIVIDSIPIFFSKVVEDKSAEDNTIGVEAKKFNARFPIIYGNCVRRGISIVGLTFYKLNPGATHDNRVLPRGEWQKYMSSLTLELLKGDLIFDNDVLVGHDVKVKIKKSKLQEFDKKDEFIVKLYYNGGFNIIDEYTQIFIEIGMIEKGGAWYKLPDSGDIVGPKLQGKDAVISFFKDNSEYFNLILQKYNEYI